MARFQGQNKVPGCDTKLPNILLSIRDYFHQAHLPYRARKETESKPAWLLSQFEKWRRTKGGFFPLRNDKTTTKTCNFFSNIAAKRVH